MKDPRIKNYGKPIIRVKPAIDEPYAGLFGDTTFTAVVEEVIADPHSEYTVKDLCELTGKRKKKVKRVLYRLVQLGVLLTNNHIAYAVNRESKIVTALTFLAYGVGDDIYCTETMLLAIKEYIR